MRIHPLKYLSLLLASSLALTVIGVDGARAQSGSVLSDLDDPQVRERYRKEVAQRIACQKPETAAARWAGFERAHDHKWDRFAMGCAVADGAASLNDISLPTNLLWAWLTFRVQNIERHLLVLGAHLEYFDVLNRSYSDHYQGIEISTELGLRWEQTKTSAKAIVDKLDPLMVKLPEARVLRAAFYLASTQREATAVEQNHAVKKASEDLEVALTEKPEALDGLAAFMRGQVLVTLPELLGGDGVRGIELLEKAHAFNPNDLAVHRALVEAYLGERETDKATEILKTALKVDPGADNPQDYVDEMKFLGGVADRLGDEALVRRFADLRQAALQKAPELLSRKQTAAFGHGGEDLITGKHADETR